MNFHQVPGEVAWHIRQLFSKPHPIVRRDMSRGERKRVFFYKSPGSQSGSTFLRHEQLAGVFSKITDTIITDDIKKVDCDSILIGAKGTLDQLALARETALAPRPLFLYDPVDELINPARLRGRIDGLIASSYNQYNALVSTIGCPVYCLLHHVDFRIPRQHQMTSRCSIGYFGAQGNAFIPPEISKSIDFVDATRPMVNDWFARLGDYACHYCVRRKREKSHSYKPSTKLYLAACVGVAVITTRDESDAGILLPPDYPFFLESRNAKSIIELLEYVHESFGSAIFDRARRDVANLRGWDYSDQLEQARYLIGVLSSLDQKR